MATTVSTRGAWSCVEETSGSVKCEGCVVSGSCEFTHIVTFLRAGPDNELSVTFTSTHFLMGVVISCISPPSSSSSCTVRTEWASTNEVMRRAEATPPSDNSPPNKQYQRVGTGVYRNTTFLRSSDLFVELRHLILQLLHRTMVSGRVYMVSGWVHRRTMVSGRVYRRTMVSGRVYMVSGRVHRRTMVSGRLHSRP